MFTQPFAIPAFLLLIVALPLILGLIPRNRLYGFRTGRTLADDAVWYPVNRVAGVAIAFASGVYWAVAVTHRYDRAAAGNFSVWLLHLAAFAIPLIIGLVVAEWYSRRL